MVVRYQPSDELPYESEACEDLLWALSLVIAYADDSCFELSKTHEWAQIHKVIGMDRDATNEEIRANVDAGLRKLGWEWSSVGPYRWNRV